MPKKSSLIIIIGAIIVLGGLLLIYLLKNPRPALSPQDEAELKTDPDSQTAVTIQPTFNLLTESPSMQITSSAFQDNEPIPSIYTCNGKNVNPPLIFVDVVKDAKSLALIVHDPDAPSGDWIHWLVWNIPATISGIAESSVPESAVQGTNDFGKINYGGPCPPSGTHHYIFELYALNSQLDLPGTAKVQDLQNAMKGHVLASRKLTGIYTKQ